MNDKIIYPIGADGWPIEPGVITPWSTPTGDKSSQVETNDPNPQKDSPKKSPQY